MLFAQYFTKIDLTFGSIKTIYKKGGFVVLIFGDREYDVHGIVR